MITLICKTFSCWCALPCCNKISVSHFFQTSCACKPQGWCTKMRVTAPKTSLPQIYLEAQPRQYSHAIPINRYFIPIWWHTLNDRLAQAVVVLGPYAVLVSSSAKRPLLKLVLQFPALYFTLAAWSLPFPLLQQDVFCILVMNNQCFKRFKISACILNSQCLCVL